ncbi:hypothetical protein ACFFX0_15575 [Citricoccus parietis]|uniref:Uncharacterized protein n=1 Tax=Citricoccus parietis TaxID=592307 RepID=A0ABV5G236_9MICC
MVVASPAASKPPVFHRKVTRRRSREPRTCSISVPASGGSQGGGTHGRSSVVPSGESSLEVMEPG